MSKEKLIRDFLGNELFCSVMVIGLDGKVWAYNKSPQAGEVEQIIQGFKKPAKINDIQLIGEKYQIYIREKNRFYGQNEKRGCIIVRSKNAFIVGMFPKKLEVFPRKTPRHHFQSRTIRNISPNFSG
eukprot:gene20117-24122_t